MPSAREWRVVTRAGRLPPWRFVAREIAQRRLLDALVRAVDLDRAPRADSALHDYVRLEPFTPHHAKRASCATEKLVRFLHAAADGVQGMVTVAGAWGGAGATATSRQSVASCCQRSWAPCASNA